jgi:uncharacterized SAM-binding protein YcdF (DUF218 family)
MDTVFFVFSKIVWALLRPETLFLLVLFLSWGLLWLGRHRAAKRTLGLTLSGLVLVAVFPLADLLMGPLERRFVAQPTVQNVSHIIVLGGSEVPDLTLAWNQAQLNEAGERYLAGVSLANRFSEADLVFSGGSGALVSSEVREAGIAEMIFLNAGIAPDRLYIESASRNTAENARNTLTLFKDVPQGQTLLVTSAAHMPRAIASFCTAGWQNLVAWPVDFRSGAFWGRVGWNLAGNLDDLNKGAKEWIGLLAYRWTGRISAGSEQGCGQETWE